MVNNKHVVKVSIFGDEYQIRTTAPDDTYVLRIAKFVDERMHEIKQVLNPSSTTKVAILAALNIADELMSGQEEQKRQIDAYRTQIDSLSKRLDEVLDESDQEGSD